VKGTKLIVYCLISELSVIMFFFNVHSFWQRLLLIVFAHSLACALMAVYLAGEFSGRYFDVGRNPAFALFFGFCFFIPVFGIAGIVIYLLSLKYLLPHGNRTEFSTVSLPPFMAESGGTAQGMGEGGAWSRLKVAYVPRDLRLKALLAANNSSGMNSSRLLQFATGDSDDEIRLLAFNLFDRREKVISSSISHALHSLRETVDAGKRRETFRTLAFSYWEAVYNDIVQDELADFYIGQSLEYAQQAADLGEEDPALQILMGRLFLRKGEIDRAEDAINAALDNGIHQDKAIPYLAELAYRKRDFAKLKHYFRTVRMLRHKPGIGPVAQFWVTIYD
jgi:polysaccharide biosynthesis protein PelE